MKTGFQKALGEALDQCTTVATAGERWAKKDNTWSPPRPDLARVVCAACRCTETGIVVLGARHWDPWMHQQAEAFGISEKALAEEGFIDQYGKFLTREEAYQIAKNQNQLIRDDYEDGVLYSENLY